MALLLKGKRFPRWVQGRVKVGSVFRMGVGASAYCLLGARSVGQPGCSAWQSLYLLVITLRCGCHHKRNCFGRISRIQMTSSIRIGRE